MAERARAQRTVAVAGGPPTDVQTAYELALEQTAVAGFTIAGPSVSVRQHARALLGRRTWYLHDRP